MSTTEFLTMTMFTLGVYSFVMMLSTEKHRISRRLMIGGISCLLLLVSIAMTIVARQNGG